MTGREHVEAQPRPLWRLQLIGGWDLCRDSGPEAVTIPHRSQRLVAYLALAGPVPRLVAAGALWPDATEHHALSNLRTTARGVRAACPGLLAGGRDPLDLSAEVFVDIRRVRASFAGTPDEDGALTLLRARGDLLAGWYEDWVIFEQERFRAQRLLLLDEAACHSLLNGAPRLALSLAQLAVSLDPLCESALRTLVEVHLSMGNRVEALRDYHQFRVRSEQEFGIAPSGLLAALVEPLLAERAARAARTRGRATGRRGAPLTSPSADG